MPVPREDSGRFVILLAALAGFIRSVDKAVRRRLDLWIDRNGAAAEAHHALASVRGDTGPPRDLAVVLNAQDRGIPGCAMAPGVPAAVVEPAFHPRSGHVLPANYENVNHAV